MIPTEHVPHEFLKKPNDFPNTLWSASIKKWSISSQYPLGIVHGSIGQRGEISVETEALLIDNGITWNEFSDEVLSCLPQMPWSIPESEIKMRRDFRTTRIFSVDPLTARDLDDALSVTVLDDNIFEIGVHIADVGFFIEPDSYLDREAFHRATTVYLTQKVPPFPAYRLIIFIITLIGYPHVAKTPV